MLMLMLMIEFFGLLCSFSPARHTPHRSALPSVPISSRALRMYPMVSRLLLSVPWKTNRQVTSIVSCFAKPNLPTSTDRPSCVPSMMDVETRLASLSKEVLGYALIRKRKNAWMNDRVWNIYKPIRVFSHCEVSLGRDFLRLGSLFLLAVVWLPASIAY